MKKILSRVAVTVFALFALGTLYGAVLPTEPVAETCPVSGWAFGVYVAETESVRYIAHGPIAAWIEDGGLALTSPTGREEHFAFDFSRAEDGVLVITFRVLEEPEGYEPAWRMVDRNTLRMNPLMCAFFGNPTPSGDMLYFGVLGGLVDHTHSGIELIRPDAAKVWR